VIRTFAALKAVLGLLYAAPKDVFLRGAILMS
jgi:hypothetical protein